ncbi:MAG: hypothetical protein PHN44_01920 [Candidatus Marinimicrobia bacterium]|jgi:hypothetical protein|nr:hypothetical protein [Candidatus Neomarinimicrobiota bacterium]MDD5540438.1 hypothetical protein [Candidatus Neomarinimicrobiota bacterium]
MLTITEYEGDVTYKKPMTTMREWIDQYFIGIDIERNRIPPSFEERRRWCTVCDQIYWPYQNGSNYKYVDYFEAGHLPKISFRNYRAVCPLCMQGEGDFFRDIQAKFKLTEKSPVGHRLLIYDKLLDLYKAGGIDVLTMPILRYQLFKQLGIIKDGEK